VPVADKKSNSMQLLKDQAITELWIYIYIVKERKKKKKRKKRKKKRKM
jgi:hypothetical protein